MESNYLWSLRLMIFFGITVFFLLIAVNGTAKTITVDDDGEADFSRIQDAIDNCTNRDTIRVLAGIYEENIVVNKSIYLIGDGFEVTTIDGLGYGNVVTITANQVNISGFSVIGSKCNECYLSGIKIESDNNRIFNNSFSNNDYGISLDYSRNNTIQNNNCFGNYFGIMLLDSSNNNIIKNNTSLNNDNGIWLGDSNNNTIENNTCWYNENSIRLHHSNNNIFTNNTCTNNTGASIWLASSDNNTINNNTFENNHSGMHFSYSSNNTITNNSIVGCERGIYFRAYSKSNIVNYNKIFNNSDYGINATKNNGYVIQAAFNWWGDSSGPQHFENNSMGWGDIVTDNVDFNSWLDEDGNIVYLPDGGEDGENEDQFVRLLLIIILVSLLSLIFILIIRTHV